MLTNQALIAAFPLTTVLDSKRIVVSPLEGSPLFTLVKATRSDSNHNKFNETTGEFDINITDIEYMANAKDDVLGVCTHDRVMDEITEVVSTAVTDHMMFAKNVVAPAIEDLVVKTCNSILELSPSALLGMEVITWAPPKPLLNSGLETSVRKFEDLPYDVPKLAMKLPDLTVTEIIELMKSGSGDLDNDITEWASVKGDSFFISIWENIFQIKQAGLTDRVPVTFRSFVYDAPDSLDNALAIYLLSRRLADSPLPNTEMNLTSFNSLIIDYRNQSGARLSHAFNEFDKVNKISQLVRSVDGNKTIVNESVYRRWIDAGGENEILFGNILVQPFSSTVDEINSKAPMLKAEWNKYSALTSVVERNRLFTRTKEFLLAHFREQIRNVTEGEEATIGNREIILKKFTDLIDEVREDETKDLWALCLKLVCKARFYKTDAERILSGIERIKKENPQVSVREAAAISLLEYINYWISTQFVVKIV